MSIEDDYREHEVEQSNQPQEGEQSSPSKFVPYQPREGSYSRPATYNPQEYDPLTPTAEVGGMPDPSSALYTQSGEVRIADESEHKKGILKTIIVIVLIVFILGVIGGIVLMIHGARSADDVSDSTVMEQDNLDSALSQQASSLAELPDLVSLFGLSLDNAFAELDGEYGVVSRAAGSSAEFKSDCTTVVTLVRLEEPMAVAGQKEDATAESSSDSNTTEQSTESSKSEDAADEAEETISTTTIVSDDAEQPHIKLLLDTHDMVVGAVISLDLESIKFPETSFADLTASKSFLKEVLKAVGLDWPDSYQYVAPSAKDYTTYKEGSTTDKAMESYTFEGDSDLETSPEKWQVKISYDYSQAASQDADSLSDVKRTMVVSLA